MSDGSVFDPWDGGFTLSAMFPRGTSTLPTRPFRNTRDRLVVIFAGLTLATEDDNEKSPFALVGIDKSHGAFVAASRGRLPVLRCFIYKVL
ncbi:MAG TPA: hypothetical protein VMU69_32250, partial [Bradyrhizobium sp.]|nr:hypothetical protein [Bradyrhizobium sp.]